MFGFLFRLFRKRDTVVYQLKQGGKIVYIGITNDPKRREREHRNKGKRFSHMHVVSKRMSKDEARRDEVNRLADYRRRKGKNPKYNKGTNG